MVDLTRWLLKTSPGLTICSAVILAGISGCRSAAETVPHASSQWHLEATPGGYPVPAAPAPQAPYEEDILPAPAPVSPMSEPAAAPAATLETVERDDESDLSTPPELTAVRPELPMPEVTTPVDAVAEPEIARTNPKPESTRFPFPDQAPAEEPRSKENPKVASSPPVKPEAPAVPEQKPFITPDDIQKGAELGDRSEIATLPQKANSAVVAEPPAIGPSSSNNPGKKPEVQAPVVSPEKAAINDADSGEPEATPDSTLPAIELPMPEPAADINSKPVPDRVVAEATTTSATTAPATTTTDSKLPTDLKLPGETVTSPIEELSPVDVTEFEHEVFSATVDSDGNTYVTHRNGISQITPDGQVSSWSTLAAPRGQARTADGRHIVCDHRTRSVLALDDAGKTIATLARRSDGKFLRAPTHLTLDSEGGIYFSDPGYARIKTPLGRVHYVGLDGRVNLVCQKLGYPDGLAVSLDGAKLYIIESQKQRISECEILSPGRIGPLKTLCQLPVKDEAAADNFASGLAIDQAGRLYVGRHGMRRVDIFDSTGDHIDSLGVPFQVNSVSLSPDRHTLLVTGSDENGKGMLAVTGTGTNR